MNKNIRIRTDINQDKEIKVQLNQDFDLIEILSLNISQKEAYRSFCSDYGVLVGRVLTNTSFGVPNVKVSIFIPISEEDKLNPEISRIYPYEIVSDKNIDGVRYNLLTPKCIDECHTPIGTFPDKRQILDNPILSEIHEKYYKFTTTTNDSGDYLFFGLPLGQQIVHLDVDISDIGILSQKPYNLIDKGADNSLFESPRKFKSSNDLDSLAQVRTINTAVNIIPFWGDLETCEIGITRLDIDLRLEIEPSAFFIGSIFKDDIKNSVNKKCSPQRKNGNLEQLVTGEGNIDMIRLLPNGDIEEFNVSGNRLIDEDGVFAYQIPMNLDRVITDEFGNLVATSDPKIGLPTRAKVRFKIYFDDFINFEENKKTASYLVPNNPNTYSDVDFSFDESTNVQNFKDLYWNKIYTIKQFIPRYQKNSLMETRQFLGIKDVENDNNKNVIFPYNNIDTDNSPFLFLITFLLLLAGIFIFLIAFINATIVRVINGIINVVNFLNPGDDIDSIKCISIECDGNRYAPGCVGDGADQFLEEYPSGVLDPEGNLTLDCICARLVNAFGAKESYDFYNDWINGSLYFPTFKYKKRKNGKEKFCEYECDLYDPNSVNNCGERFLLDRCVGNGIGSKSKTTIYDGIIHKDDDNDQLYYAPITHVGRTRLFATDIISLGSINKCDWQGIFRFIDKIPSTSYNSVPDLTEFEDGAIETSGKEGLFYNTLICGGKPLSNTQNCINISRICELGVGTDDNRSDEITNVLGVGGGLADNIINNRDIEDLIVRDLLVLSNISPSNIILSSTSVNNHALFNNSGSDGTNPYNLYRDYENYYTKLPNGGSFYFYFGINKGRTAIDKFKRKYFGNCESCKVNKIVILGDVNKVSTFNGNDGSISLSVIGGVQPYTYKWSSNNGFTSTNDNISNLISDYYTVKVVDNNGLSAKKTFFVSNPLPLQCDAITFDVSYFGANDGNILVNGIGGGLEPYTIQVVNEDSNQIIFNQILPNGINSAYISGTNQNDGNLPIGNYSYLVTDSNNTSCGGNLIINQPPQLNLIVNKTDVSCNGAMDGSISLVPSGGIPPYNFYTVGNGQTYTTQTINGIDGGNYSGNVSDLSGIIINFNLNIMEPQAITYTDSSNNVSCNGLNDGNINIFLNGGTPPYTYNWVNNSGFSVNNLTTSSLININNIGNVNSGSTNPVTQNKISGIYTFTVLDSNNCQFTFTKEIKEPNELNLTLVNVVNTSGLGGNGSITVNGFGGNPEINNGLYYFKLKQGMTLINTINTNSNTVTFNNLNSGTYKIELTDVNSCVSNVLTVVIL